MENHEQKRKVNWEDLGKIMPQSSLRSSHKTPVYASDVLLQVILPIVLILAFIVFTRIKVLEHFVAEVKEQEGWKQYRVAYLEIQKQVLFKVLEEVKAEKRREFGIDTFLHKAIEIQEGQLVDEAFMKMCRTTYEKLERYRSQEQNTIYQNVIDLTSQELKKITQEKQFLKFDEFESANENLVKKEIEDFLEGMTKDTINLQHTAIREIEDYFVNNPHKLKDRKLDQLLDEYISSSEEAKPDIASQLYERLYEKLQFDLEQKDCPFLSETWQDMLTE